MIKLLLFLFTSLASCAAQQSGLLLGLSSRGCSSTDVPDGCTQRWRTLWVAPRNGAVTVIAELPDLIVPTVNGFWHVGVRTYCEPLDWSLSVKDKLFALPVKERPVIEGVVPCEEASKAAETYYEQLM